MKMIENLRFQLLEITLSILELRIILKQLICLQP